MLAVITGDLEGINSRGAMPSVVGNKKPTSPHPAPVWLAKSAYTSAYTPPSAKKKGLRLSTYAFDVIGSGGRI